MATPRGARHYDLEQRLRDLEDKVRKMATHALAQRQIVVTSGSIEVTSPGAINVDGTSVRPLTVQDENGNVATGVAQIDFQGAGVTATAGTGTLVPLEADGDGPTDYVFGSDGAILAAEVSIDEEIMVDDTTGQPLVSDDTGEPLTGRG